MTGQVQWHIRALTPSDWPAVEAIYREGIEEGNATFESSPPTWEHFDAHKLTLGRLVAVEEDDTVIGWIAASPISARAAYRGVIEHSLYVSSAARGRRTGSALMAAFLSAADAAGIWTVQATIFAENTASLALHDRFGFRVVGRRERIAQMQVGPSAGQWRDTLLLERRLA